MSEPAATVVDLPAGLREGDVVAGRYRLEHILGRGGMGVVVAAHHVELDERVAVKFLSTSALTDPEAVARFDREIRAAARMKNEHVARVYDAGKLPDGGRYMVLEFLDGEDLAARVQRTGPLDPMLAARYLLQACSAVQEAHGLGIVHRDLKPANLYVIERADGAEVIKVLDFGVMKRMPGGKGGVEAQQTEPGTIVGTPFYTSPEQLRGSAQVDARTDIWSLGATLFELLTSVPPFSGKTYPQIIANVLEAPPRAFGAIAATLPVGMEQVVHRCLEKDPADRYESVADLAVALAETIELDSEQKGLLERIVRHELVSSPFSSPSALLTPIGVQSRLAARVTPGTKEYQARGQTRRRLFIVTGVAVLSALSVVGVGLRWLPWFPAQSAPVPSATATARPLGQHRPLVEATSPAQPPPTAAPEPSAVATVTAPRPSSAHAPSQGRTKAAPTAAPLEEPATASSALPNGRKKNPLLVRPR